MMSELLEVLCWWGKEFIGKQQVRIAPAAYIPRIPSSNNGIVSFDI